MSAIKKPKWNKKLGWIVCFSKQPKKTTEKITQRSHQRKERLEYLKKFFAEKFKKLEAMLPATIRIISKAEIFGICNIVGPTSDCEKLRKKMAEDNFASMTKNYPTNG